MGIRRSLRLEIYGVMAVTWLLIPAFGAAQDQAKLLLVATAATESAEAVEQVGDSAVSRIGDSHSVDAFEEASVRASLLLWEIADASLRGVPLSETEPILARVVEALEHGRQLMGEGRIEVSSGAMEDLDRWLRLLEGYYAPREVSAP